MPLPTPKLDDRRFADLMADAVATIDAISPEWTDRNPSDPGMTLLEAFAFLTEAMLYRLNRVPLKLYVAMLNLAGAQLRPPAAAATKLVFTRTAGEGEALTIPAGTRAATSDGSVEFVITRAVNLAKGAKTAEAPALNCALVEAELLGLGSGAPGQSFQIKAPPIIAPSGDGLDVVVGVETVKGEDAGDLTTQGVGGKVFLVWREVESFGEAGIGDRV
jgi:Baseplate J-like protein